MINGNQTPRNPLDRHLQPSSSPTVPIRQKENYSSLTTVVRRKPVLDALISFLVICQLAFSMATNHLFIDFLQLLYPTIEKLIPKSRTTIRGYIMAAFEAKKVKVKLALAKSKSQIHFSFDLWTSPNHLALLGVVGHFINEKGENQSVSNVL